MLTKNCVWKAQKLKKLKADYEDADLNEAKSANATRARGMLIRSIDDTKKHLLAECKTVLQIWKAIHDDFAKVGPQMQNQQLARICQVQFKGRFEDYFRKLDREVTKLRQAGGSFPDELLVATASAAVRKHTEVWNYVFDDPNKKYGEIKHQLCKYDGPKEKVDSSEQSALKIATENLEKTRKDLEEANQKLAAMEFEPNANRGAEANYGRRGSGNGQWSRGARSGNRGNRRDYQGRQQSGYRNGDNGEQPKCWDCNMPGHFSKGCALRGRNIVGRNMRGNGRSNNELDSSASMTNGSNVSSSTLEMFMSAINPNNDNKDMSIV
ncbi:hypothetical protein TYRP_023707 [Tyrophagus putrescentiae]|nr:hypothetical protein TYRP_023707 [Tyrophagus putrescentiae]